MRKYEGIKDPYEKLKEFTRGKDITREHYQAFIDSIEGLPDHEKESLKELTPEKYLGYAMQLAYNVKTY